MIDNQFYAPKLLNKLIIHYMGVLPLWCGIIFKKSKKKRDTNSHVENWFRILKNDVLVQTETKVKGNKTKLLNMMEFVIEVESTLQTR